MASTTVHLKDTEDVVAWIAANTSRVIANAGHDGHDIDTVMTRMTSDTILNTIRDAYVYRCQKGLDRPESIQKIGVRLIAEYRRTYGIN